MNHIFKTVWNARRRQIVVVSDVCGSKQARGDDAKSGAEASVVEAGEPEHVFKRTLLAGAVALMAAASAQASVDAHFDVDADVSGKTTHNNVQIDQGVTVTNDNKYCIGDHCMNVDDLYTVEGKLNNSGTILGDGGNWKISEAENSGSMTAGSVELSAQSGTTTAFTNDAQGTVNVSELKGTGKLVNAGTMSLGSLSTDGDVENTGSLAVVQDVTVGEGETFSNSGTQLDLANVTVSGTLTNTAQSGAELDSLTVNGTVDGTGNLTVNGLTNVAADKSLTQGTLTAKGNVTNAGTTQLTTLDLQNADFENSATAVVGTISGTGNVTNTAGTLTTSQGMTIAAGKTFSNASGAEAALGGTTTINGAFQNAGSVTGEDMKFAADTENTNSGSLDLSGDLSVNGTLTNTGSKFEAADITVAGSLVNNASSGASAESLAVVSGTSSGSVSGTGSVSVAGETSLAGGTSLAQGSLSTGTLNSFGTLNLTDKLTTSGTADFQSGSSGSVKNAEVGGAMTHSGSMHFEVLQSSSSIANKAGTLDIDALTGSATVTNESGATLDLETGSAQMAALTNSGTAKVGNADISGALQNTAGTLTAKADTTITAGSFTNSAEADLVNATVTGKVTSSDTLNVTGKLAAQDAVEFQSGATGTIADAEVTGNVSNAGEVTLTKLAASAQVTNTNKLTITDLTGEAQVTNESGATLTSTGSLALTSLSSAGTAVLGTVTATGDVSNTGSMTSTGKVSADSFTQDSANSAELAALDVETLTVAQGTLGTTGAIETSTGTNNATLSAADLTATTSFTNNSSLTSTGTADITAYTQGSGATGTFSTATFKGTGTLAGTVTADTLTIAEAASYDGAASLSAKTLNVSGDLKLTGSVSSDTSATIAAGKTLAGSQIALNAAVINGTLEGGVNGTTISSLTTSEGAVLKTTGTMTLTNVTEGSLDHVTYEQTGNGSLVVADATWFQNSTVNFFGGSVDRSGKTLGTGNTYNIKREGAGDLVDVASLSVQMLDGRLDSSWMDNRTVLTVDTVTSDNTFNLLEGGVLDVDSISLTADNTDKTLNLQGGAISTTLDQFFSGVKTDAISMEAINEETGRIEISGSVIGLTTVGDIYDGIKNHVGFDSGDIVFNDAAITVELVNTVNQKIAAQAGDASSNISVHYTGSTDQVFTADVANRIIAANADVHAIFDNATLYSRTDSDETGKDLVIGVDSEDGKAAITGSIGFANVALTDTVTVTNGAEFALIGKEDASYSSLVGDNGGTVNVTGDGSQFTLGTLGRSGMSGKVDAVNLTESGKLLAKGGDYQVTTIDAQGSTVETGASAKLAATKLTLDGTSTLTNAGSLTAATFVDAAGSASTNTGLINVTEAATVNGTFTNSTAGVAVFSNRLTVNGKVENVSTGRNSGMSVAGLTVNASEGFTNSGTLISTAENYIKGTGAANTSAAFTNAAGGVVDFTAAKTVIGANADSSVSGASTLAAGQNVYVHNFGTMNFGDLDIQKGGELINFEDASVTASNITMDAISAITNWGTVNVTGTFAADGTIRNVGTIGANTAEIASLTNSDEGGLVVREALNVADSLTNAEGAVIDARDAVATFAADAEFSNAGTVLVKSLSLGEGSTFTNDGDVAGEALSVASDAEVTNSQTMSFTSADIQGHYQNASTGEVSFSEAMTISGSGFFENMGTALVSKDVTISGNGKLYQLGENGSFTAAENLTMKDNAEVIQTAGEFVVTKALDFQSGTLSFQGELTGDETPVTGSILLAGDIGGSLTIENAVVTIGSYTDTASPETLAQSDDLPDAKHVLISSDAPLSLGTNGKLYVGEDARTNVESLNAGDATFGADSLFVIDASKMTSDENGAAALVGSGTLTLDANAKLHIENMGWGSFYVTKGFEQTKLELTSWNGSNLSWSLEGDKHFVFKQDESGNLILIVEDGAVNPDDPSELLPDAFEGTAGSGLVGEIIYDAATWDPNRTDVIGFIRRATNDSYLDESLMVRTLNETMEIAAMGGVLNQNLTFAGNVADMAERHLSYEDSHFDKNGNLRTWQGVRLWADVLGQHVDQSLDFTGGNADFDGENYGFIMGGDFIAGNGVRFGAAFAYQNGSVDSNGAAVSTSNDADAYSLTGYAAKNFGAFNVMGSIAYTRVDSDVSQTMPSSMGLGSHTLDQSDDVLSLGVKAEYRLQVGESVAFVPYVGVRNITIFSSNETSKMGGVDAFRYDTDTLNQWQVPVGVAFQGGLKTASGWTARSMLDVSVTPVMGDKDVDTDVSIGGFSAVDTVSTTVSDSVMGAVRFGVSAEKDNFSIGADLGYAGSGDTKAFSFGLKARCAF